MAFLAVLPWLDCFCQSRLAVNVIDQDETSTSRIDAGVNDRMAVISAAGDRGGFQKICGLLQS